MRGKRLIVLLLAALLAPAGTARAGTPQVAIFYYPWYGTPSYDGAYEHWQQDAHHPPADIASNYYPVRGVYSSSDLAVVNAQMAEIAAAGIGQVVVSWWGTGSPEDERLPEVVAAARAHGLVVAVQIEPYPGRTVASTEADIERLRGLGISTFYVYRAFDLPAADWAPMNDSLSGVRVLAQTGLAGLAAAGHFAGLYTYDVLVYGGDDFPRICAEAHALGVICAPSVGPGFDAARATGDQQVKPRRDGRTYDAMWEAALGAGADEITITSFNEWHEGTQIEPAEARPGYASYRGSYGLTGRAARDAYLVRTALWTHVYWLRRATDRRAQFVGS